jgi:propanol-preferring alcohol dehydrogenase
LPAARKRRYWQSNSVHTITSTALLSIAAMNEVFPFADVPKAYERMMSGQARFRVVLDVATT